MTAITCTATHTHTVEHFADPFKKCQVCGGWVDGYVIAPHHPEDGENWPCRHRGYDDLCPSWSPVDGCRCAEHAPLPQRVRPGPRSSTGHATSRAAGDEPLGLLAEALGPAPWEMTEADYTFEVDLIREVIADPDLVPVVDFDDALGRPRYDPDVEQEFARLGELIPPEFSALDLAPADLYRAIVEWADRAGLRAHIEAFSEGRTA